MKVANQTEWTISRGMPCPLCGQTVFPSANAIRRHDEFCPGNLAFQTINERRHALMKNRPYADKTNRELEQTLAKAVKTPSGIVDATAFGDTNKKYLVGYPSGASHIATTNAATTTDLIYTNTTVTYPFSQQAWDLSDTYVWKDDGTLERSGPTKIAEVGPKSVAAKVKKTEDDLAWLRRRVEEICWVPV